MIKNILSVLAGLAVAFIIIMGFEGISGKIYPMPADMDMNNKEALGTFMKNAPVSAMLVILLGYLISSFAGGYVATRISKSMRRGMIVGFVLLIAGIINIATIPHPLWMAIISVLIYIPAAWAGSKLALDR